MRHVREEFGLVAARLLEPSGVRGECVLRREQLRFLPFEPLRVFLELHIGLFEFSLLRFEPRLRVDECAAAFFESFIRYAQLFLLHLQFLVELLGLGERILQTLAIQGGLDKVAHAVRHQLQEFLIARGRRPHETQLDNTVDRAVVFDRLHDHAGRRACAGAGYDLDVIVGHLVQYDRPMRSSGLANEAFAIMEIARALFAFRAEAVCRDAPQFAIDPVAHINRGDHDVHVLREGLEYRASHEWRRRLADHSLGEEPLA
ncbi:hypothetical protein LMG29739_03488 [Paraburkholderia solisilvae]|uniref:Uncharacterized protein n=1 Tax=Paraburkholderia solisilvae TaxID=624376 RepID=A0A6J5E701_9BURK|nr:hypothetical protein LMG29739_03488 [Paraburkholderia solisilvae]